MSRTDSATIGNFHAVSHSQWWRSHRDAFQLTEEVALLRRLVVAHALPNHCIAILMVVPQCWNTISGRSIRRIDSDVCVIAGTNHNFLAPVAKDISRSTRIVFRVVVHLATRTGEQSTALVLIHSSLFFCSRTVEHFVAKVAIPINTEVEVRPEQSPVPTRIITRNRHRQKFVCHSGNQSRLRTSALTTRIIIREVSAKRTTIVASALQAVVNLRCRSVAIVHGRIVLIACEELQALAVRVEVAYNRSIAVSQACR